MCIRDRVLALAYDVESIVIGGGLTGLGTALLDGMAQHFDTWSETSPLLASLDLGGLTRLLTDERPVHAIGAAIMGGLDG